MIRSRPPASTHAESSHVVKEDPRGVVGPIFASILPQRFLAGFRFEAGDMSPRRHVFCLRP